MTGEEIVRALERGGWQVVRQRGSHHRLENADRPANGVTVAVHAGREVPEGTLRAILRRTGLSRDEFDALRRR